MVSTTPVESRFCRQGGVPVTPHPSIEPRRPDRLTATEAVVLLGVTFDQFRYAVYSYVKGSPVVKSNVGRGRGPRNEQGHPKESSSNRRKFEWMPTPIEGSYQSKKAIYKTSDILRLKAIGHFRKCKSPAGSLSTPTSP